MSRTPSPEITESVRTVVTADMTARSLATDPAEKLPEMFATPFMIANMERACANLLNPMLAPGELSVGAKIEVSHLAPTAVGATVTCSARFVELQAPLYWFEVWAEDERRRIGKGRIARAIVKEEDLIARAAS